MENLVIKAVIIREHYDTISVLMHGLHINEKTLNIHTAKWDDIETSYMRHVINMQEDCEGLCLLAYVNENPAGFIFGYVEEPDDSRFEEYTGKALYVSDGFVTAGYRRRGIYKMLNSQLEKHFIGMGIKRMTRLTLVNNKNMRNFLEQENYSATRIVYEKWL